MPASTTQGAEKAVTTFLATIGGSTGPHEAHGAGQTRREDVRGARKPAGRQRMLDTKKTWAKKEQPGPIEPQKRQ